MSRRDDRISLVDMLIHAKEAVALFGSVLATTSRLRAMWM